MDKNGKATDASRRIRRIRKSGFPLWDLCEEFFEGYVATGAAAVTLSEAVRKSAAQHNPVTKKRPPSAFKGLDISSDSSDVEPDREGEFSCRRKDARDSIYHFPTGASSRSASTGPSRASVGSSSRRTSGSQNFGSIGDMASAANSLASAMRERTGSKCQRTDGPSLLSRALALAQADGLDEDTILDAAPFFKDEQEAAIFLGIEQRETRRKYLLRHIRPTLSQNGACRVQQFSDRLFDVDPLPSPPPLH